MYPSESKSPKLLPNLLKRTVMRCSNQFQWCPLSRLCYSSNSSCTVTLYNNG